MAGWTGGRAVRATLVIVLCALVCGCHSTHHPAAPASSPTRTTTAPSPATTSTQSMTTPSTAPMVRIRPLPVRPVRGSKLTTPDKCPATNPNAPVAPTDTLVTCDLSRTNIYTLGPETMQLALTRVDPPTPLTADYFEVH